MPSPYSDDLREKVIASVDRGEKKTMSAECYKLAEIL